MSVGMSVANIGTEGVDRSLMMKLRDRGTTPEPLSSYWLEEVVAAGVAVVAGVEVVLAPSLGEEELLALASEDFGFALP